MDNHIPADIDQYSEEYLMVMGLMNLKDLAKIMEISTSDALAMIQRGVFSAVTVRGNLYIRSWDLVCYLRRNGSTGNGTASG